MKLSNILEISAFTAVLAVAAACNDAEYSAIENRIYISEAVEADRSTQQILNQLVIGETQIPVHVRLAQPAEEDIRVTLDLAPEFIKEYNDINGTTYEMLPAEYLSFEKTAVITKGNLSSDAVVLNVKPYPVGDNPYALAIKLTDTDSCIPLTEKSSRLLYVFTKPVQQLVPGMDRSHMPTGRDKNWGISAENWTLEMWINMDILGTRAGQYNNQAIFSNNRSEGSGDEVYIRWGDASIDGDKINGKFFGGKSEIISTLKFAPNTWYHIAFVMENGVVTLYVNGEEDSQANTNTLMPVGFDDATFFGSGSYFVSQNAKLAQVRLWSKALTPNMIKDGMMREISPATSGLETYWKMDEGEGDVFHDATPNGRDLKCSKAPAWSDKEVNFYNPNE